MSLGSFSGVILRDMFNFQSIDRKYCLEIYELDSHAALSGVVSLLLHIILTPPHDNFN
jgi:hypothetical protein